MKEEKTRSHRELLSYRRFTVEQWVLLATGICLMAFVAIIVLLFVPMLTNKSGHTLVPQPVPQTAISQDWVPPPTWTPGPTPIFVSTPVATTVYDGSIPTPMYTPRATSLPGPVLPLFPVPRPIDVIDLARIMQGESAADLDAAYYVGWVAKNRLLHEGYGDTYALVSSGFFGYRGDFQPRQKFIDLAARIIRTKKDPTGGCLYALSRTDITKLGVPPERADVTRGEWFFFKVWPVPRRS